MRADRIRALVQTFWPMAFGIFAGIATAPAAAQGLGTSVHFNFISSKDAAERGGLQVLPDTVYTRERGYGFVSPVAQIAKEATGSICSDSKPFSFAVNLPEGNYNVNVLLGDEGHASITTLKVEARRLILKQLHAAAGRFESRRFTVNVRRSQLASGETVRLKRDEQSHPDWDDELTMEFSGARPCVQALEISKTDSAVTVYLAGDSTVTDQ